MYITPVIYLQSQKHFSRYSKSVKNRSYAQVLSVVSKRVEFFNASMRCMSQLSKMASSVGCKSNCLRNIVITIT